MSGARMLLSVINSISYVFNLLLLLLLLRHLLSRLLVRVFVCFLHLPLLPPLPDLLLWCRLLVQRMELMGGKSSLEGTQTKNRLEKTPTGLAFWLYFTVLLAEIRYFFQC